MEDNKLIAAQEAATDCANRLINERVPHPENVSEEYLLSLAKMAFDAFMEGVKYKENNV